MQTIEPTTFYIVRHGESQWNARGIIQGHKGGGLSEAGREQASNLASRLKDIKFDKIISSDSQRAKQTAEIIASILGMQIETSHELREKTSGSLDGRKKNEVRNEFRDQIERYEKMTDEQKMASKIVPEAESGNEVLVRFTQYLNKVYTGSLGKTLLIITHGAVIRTFLVSIGFANFNQLPVGSVSNTGYIVIEFDGVEFKLIETVSVNKLPQP